MAMLPSTLEAKPTRTAPDRPAREQAPVVVENHARSTVRFGLRFKAILFAVALTFFASALPVLFFWWQVRGAIDGELQEKAKAIARGLAHNSRLAVVVGDKEKLDKLCEGVLEAPDVLYVAVLGKAGDFITSNEQKDQATKEPLPEAKQALDALRKSPPKPDSAIVPSELESGLRYYDVVEPVVREAEAATESFDELGESPAPAATTAGEAVGCVAVGVSRALAERKIRTILTMCGLVAGAVFVLGLGAAWYGTRLVVAPLVELSRTAEIMAGGDLTREIPRGAADETGVLSRSFGRMAESLKHVLGRINAASEAAESAVREATEAAGRIVEGSARQSDSVTSTSAAIHEMDGAIKDVARSTERMSSAVVGTTTSLEELGSSIRQIDESVSALQAVTADTSSSVLEMGANINEAAEGIDDLGEQVERTAASIQEMAASIQNVDQLAGEARQSAETTATTIDTMAQSIREVGGHGKAAFDLAERQAHDVTDGRQAVQSTSEGMQEIRTSFEDTRTVIEGLGESSRRIGEIVDIIEDVADRTNLLSLNAAIIAAEAGEQGRAFAVVAEEIRELATKSAASTRDIASLIRGVQSDVLTAVTRMERNDQIVMQGVELARKAGQALDKIQRGGQKSLEMAQLIERATVKQLEGGVVMTGEMEKLKDQALEISRATQEQARGSKAISEAVTEMRDKALMVKKAAAEQRLGGERISQSMEKVTVMIQQIARATREQAANAKLIMDAATEVETLALEVGRSTAEQTKSSTQVVTSVEVIREAGEGNARLAREVGERLQALSEQMAELRKLVMGLRI